MYNQRTFHNELLQYQHLALVKCATDMNVLLRSQIDRVMPYEAAMAKDNMWSQFYQVRWLRHTQHLSTSAQQSSVGLRAGQAAN